MVVAVGLAGSWRIPVAYFLTRGANADVQAELLKSVICALWECGTLVTAVTFDGLPANIKTMQLLGSTMDPTADSNSFIHPANPSLRIVPICDACHMIKLARNVLCDYQIIRIPTHGAAKWSHIQALHRMQVDEGLRLGNKITNAHINYKTQKMKVKLAVQVFASSVVLALKYLRMSGSKNFQDSFPTEMLLNRINTLFDLLNIRSNFGKKNKVSITVSNAAECIAELKELKKFLLALEDTEKNKLFKSRRHTFITGFCVTINGVIDLIKQLLLGPGLHGVKLKYLLTFKLSQDNIEVLFGLIRRRGGWNNNPTAQQFMFAFRAILSHVGVVASRSSNILTDATEDVLGMSTENDDSIFDDEYTIHSELSSFVKNVCCYMAGFVVRRLLPRIKCSTCREMLVSTNLTPRDDACDSQFLLLKDRGGLVKPSRLVVHTVQVAEQGMRTLVSSIHDLSRQCAHLENVVMRRLNAVDMLPYNDHVTETADGIDSHVYSLIRQIVRFYLDVRKRHYANMYNLENRGASVRQSLNKLVLFKNQ
jgi:hypothetical protein